ncbi:GTP cyclohydrolase FolE2 [Sessilibacter corallicola]|uniref:GTP cyclohydrolase FolE2 n=1 Tax=Sessilibacter corallicola TaxID=2904075 RepID=A0ABQ0ADD7_9GAMM
MITSKIMPDVANSDVANYARKLQWVGMEKISAPIVIENNGKAIPAVAKADLYVSLDQEAVKGIHMSRLHLLLNNQLANTTINFDTIDALLKAMVESQQGISNSAKINLTFDLLLEKPSLLSNEQGYQSYPITVAAENNRGVTTVKTTLEIPYSSTCPCSASLSRQLLSEALDSEFYSNTINKEQLLQWIQSKQGSIATPHSQRSYATITMQYSNGYFPDLPSLVFQLEEAIGTPVQTAVKRQDEQEFARLNAENLMFCEDAARRFKNLLEHQTNITDYWFKVEHQESLHAHNAVVIDQKYTD